MQTLLKTPKWFFFAISSIATLMGQSLPGSVSVGIGITAPANAAIVSGTVALSAHPVATLGVASVQFFVDGVSIAAPIQASPYSTTWNTVPATNGGHTISATAIDSGGHRANASITVSVSNAPPPVVSISVGPGGASLSASQNQQFTATVTGSSNTSVSWSISPAVGTIINGLYTAPSTVASAQNIVVTATSQADASKTATARVSLTPPPPPVAISLGPASVSLSASQTTQYSATVTGTSNTGVTWNLTPSVGTILNGLYTAPATIASAQNITVTATSAADPTKSASASISLTAPAPTVSISVGPANTSLAASQSQQFTATVTGSSNTAASWSINPAVGTISNGRYTAPATIASAQNITVTATSAADPTKSASASISLTVPAPIVSMGVAPANTSLTASQSQQFTATVTGSSNTAASWSISPLVGTVSSTGLYTAPATIASAQSIAVTATSVADPTKSASASISLTVPAPTVSISVGPANTSLTASQSQQFTATVTGSSNTAASWSISPQVGTVSSTGLYTAPAAIASAQSIVVTATSVADPTKSATAAISLNPAVSITLGPASVTLTASHTQQFTATVAGSSNSGVSYTLTPALGTVSSSGLYTAPTAIATAQNVMLTATSLADATKTAVVMIALAFSPGAAQVGISLTSPTNGSKISGNTAISATTSGSVAGVQFYVDSTPIGAQVMSPPYTVNLNSVSVPDGSHTLSAVAKDASGNQSTATISVSVSNNPTGNQPLSAVTLPIEIMGSAGTTQAVQVAVPSVPGGTLRLWLQIHGLKYQTEASVQVNNSAWMPINDSTVTLLGNAGAYGGIGGGFSTLKLTMNLPAGSVVAGTDTINFQFNGTDGVTSGFRVLSFNILGPDGTALVANSSFVQDDPTTWQPPSSLASDISAGQQLWSTATLMTPAGPIVATCGMCHAQDGRDLKYFNYSNNSIRVRSMFHGLTSQQGNQIASYIRSLNTPAPANARPWNPPYQPGPGTDSLPVSQWAAGAGLDAVLDQNAEIYPYLMPGGSTSTWLQATNLSARNTPIDIQLADWNRWLPPIHPVDYWGSAFSTSSLYSLYWNIRSKLVPGDPVAYANENIDINNIGTYDTAFLTLSGRIKPTSDPSWSNPAYVTGVYATRQWEVVKMWELNQEFGLEPMAQAVFGPQAADRAWDGDVPFFVSPRLMGIPQGSPGIANGSVQAWEYLGYTWYHLQLVLNDSQRQLSGHFPIDWPYSEGSVTDFTNVDGKPHSGLMLIWLIKGLQVSNRGPQLGGDVGWSYMVNDPTRLIVNQNRALWTDTPLSTQVAAAQAYLQNWLAVVQSYTPQQFYQGGWASPTEAIDMQYYDGTFADRTAWMIPQFRHLGINPALMNQIVAWAATMWPNFQWNQLQNSVCTTFSTGETQCTTPF